MHVPANHEIETFTGQYVDVSNPDPSTIRLADIAHGLSNVCRYSGQCAWFYSVAEHAVAVCLYVKARGGSAEDQLKALHHDDPESFLTDIPRPLKSLLLPQYEEITRLMEQAIATALNVPTLDPLSHALVKEADNAILMLEAKALLPSRGENWAGNGCNIDCFPAGDEDWAPSCYPPEQAEAHFIAMHEALMLETGRTGIGRTINLSGVGPLTDVYIGEYDTVIYDHELEGDFT